MSDQPCGPTRNCAWQASRILTRAGTPTKARDLCIGIDSDGEPCGSRAAHFITPDRGLPAQPLCQLHLAIFTKAIWAELQKNDALQARRDARVKEISKLETVRQRAQAKRSTDRTIDGMVYFARRGSTVKIGFSSSPPRRLRNLETAAGLPFDEVVLVKGNRALEQRYHRRFQEHRTDGEWFQVAPEIRLEMDRLHAKAS